MNLELVEPGIEKKEIWSSKERGFRRNRAAVQLVGPAAFSYPSAVVNQCQGPLSDRRTNGLSCSPAGTPAVEGLRLLQVSAPARW